MKLFIFALFLASVSASYDSYRPSYSSYPMKGDNDLYSKLNDYGHHEAHLYNKVNTGSQYQTHIDDDSDYPVNSYRHKGYGGRRYGSY